MRAEHPRRGGLGFGGLSREETLRLATAKNPPGVALMIAGGWSLIAGCYDDGVVHTLAIGRLAGEGAVFDQARCTTPTCAASRACLLAGLQSHQHGWKTLWLAVDERERLYGV